MDATHFDVSQSRYDEAYYHVEWTRAWNAYITHVNEAPARVGAELKEFTLSQWRQDFRDRRYIRKKPIESLMFSGLTRTAELRIYNDVISRTLVFQYTGL